jgi:hypothetical protein
MPTELSLATVGVAHPNADGSNRRFEILLCTPGETVALVPEPRNKADPHAIAVFSARGVQIGYVTAERAPWIGSKVAAGGPLEAVFQQATNYGALIRVNLAGEKPVLPPDPGEPKATHEQQDEDSFWPDYIPPDD